MQDNNGGTVLAVAGEDYVVCAADTRMSTGYSILTRDYKKIDQMSPKCVMVGLSLSPGGVSDWLTWTIPPVINNCSASCRVAPFAWLPPWTIPPVINNCSASCRVAPFAWLPPCWRSNPEPFLCSGCEIKAPVLSK
jgi:hypothetical protein